MPRRTASLALSLLVLIGGCHTPPKDNVVVEYNTGQTPITVPAPRAGTYALRATTPDGDIEGVAVELEAGAPVGFRRQPDGTLVAVAGTRTVPILDAPSVWRDPEQKPAPTSSNRPAVGRKFAQAAELALVSPLALTWVFWMWITGSRVE